MKTRSTLILILLVFTSASLQAQTWNGSTSNDWNLPANWTGGVPGPGSNVTIPGGTPFSPKLFSNVSINGLNMTNATLDVNGFTFSFTSQGFYSRLDGATINNSSASTDIMFTINTGNTGHDLIIKASTFNDHVTMNLTGTNTFYEGGSAINNVFNGNYTANINGNMSAQFSVTSASVVTGNFLVDRTTAGSTLLFSSGGQVNGNFTYTNNAGGASQIGNMTTTSTINGTMNMSVNDPSPYTFWMYRMKNLTNGGSINVLNPLAFEVKNDTLKVNSLSITGYRGSAYTYLYSNSILGNVTISDDASYSGGHTTTINNNAITGNTSFTISGLNSFYECGVAGSGNTYNGTTSFTINGGSAVFFSYAASSMYNGNLTINRTQTGSSSLFPAGATITGNFTFNHSASGASQIGNTSILTQVQGKVFMNVNYTAKQSFELYRIKNFTAGGKMNITNTMGCNIQMDSLIVDSLNITQYGGNAYAYFQYNQLTGNLTLSTDSFYNGGHNTQIHSNVINGHSAFGNYGANYMQESVSASGANTFNGNTTFIGGGPGTIYISHDAKSTFNGNLTILRPASGNTRAFAQGANITGNLSYTKTSVSGVTQFGNTAAKTMINGMVNMSVVQTTSDEFEIFWMENLLNGGSISVNGSKAFYLTKDTLKLTSLSLSGYAGNAYGYLINNFITGNISTSDLPAYNNGYVTYIRNNTFTGNSSFTINGANTFVEADGTGNKNTFNGNTLFTINNSGGVYISHDAHSIFNGHLTVNRTVAGVTQMFYNGADITGNYTYTNSAGGNSILGRTTLKTIINGTININSTQNTGNEFDMYYIQNSTGGGTISVNGCKAPDIQKDTIMVTNFSITGYGGNGYAYLLNNHITGNVNLSDNGPTYSNGYVSYMRKNVIIGNVTITLTGNNTFVEADGTGNGDIITGNTLFNINGPGSVYISEDAKSIFNGNLTLNRTVAGYTRMFYSGTDLNGNLNCTNTAGGAMYMGRTT
ncbi:MAG TPA: hypothetical protein PLP34_02845, partial [Chitinophagaceae bacterium]|nr:hypothetical protein [Chitinophagaceae bacterium]